MDLTARGRRPEVGITAHEATISFRVTAEAAMKPRRVAPSSRHSTLIRDRFGSLVIGEGDGGPPRSPLRSARPYPLDPGDRRVVHRGPDRPDDHVPAGSQFIYLGGVVSYANEAKVEPWECPRI